MTDKKGLYEKYEVFKNRKPVKGAFVLLPEKDIHALFALRMYAVEVRHSNPILASDIEDWIGRLIAEEIRDSSDEV